MCQKGLDKASPSPPDRLDQDQDTENDSGVTSKLDALGDGNLSRSSPEEDRSEEEGSGRSAGDEEEGEASDDDGHYATIPVAHPRPRRVRRVS